MEILVNILLYAAIAALLYSLTYTYITPWIVRFVPFDKRIVTAGVTLVEFLALRSTIDNYVVSPLMKLLGIK